jgi:hypothetical protein
MEYLPDSLAANPPNVEKVRGKVGLEKLLISLKGLIRRP